MIGYRHTVEFLKHLNRIDLTNGTLMQKYDLLVRHVSDLPFISEEMTNFQLAWISDMQRIEAQE